MSELAPIVIFAYNRPQHLKKTLDALSKCAHCDASTIYFYADGAKKDNDPNVQAVRNLIETYDIGKIKHCIFSPINLGCKASVIKGLTAVTKQHNKIIVVEDDIVVQSDFLEYMNSCLNYFETDERIFSISGYSAHFTIPSSYTEQLFLLPRTSSWGWGTWLNRLEKVTWDLSSEFETLKNNKQLYKQFNQVMGADCSNMLAQTIAGKIDAWDIYFTYAAFKNNQPTVYPVRSRTMNIGLDGTGTNFNLKNRLTNYFFNVNKRFKVKLEAPNKLLQLPTTPLQVNHEIAINYKKLFEKPILKRVSDQLKKIILHEGSYR